MELRATMIRTCPRNPSQIFRSFASPSHRTPRYSPRPSQQHFIPTARRMASSSCSTPTTSPKPSISHGSNEENITNALGLELLPPHSHWRLTSSGTGIQRTFKFKTFKAAWSFMDRVAAQCKTARHHPEWANVYNTVFVRWTTHQPRGLSEKDVAMALFCDEHARELGVVVEEGGEGEVKGDGEDGGVEGLADGLATAAGDCCVPKKK